MRLVRVGIGLPLHVYVADLRRDGKRGAQFQETPAVLVDQSCVYRSGVSTLLVVDGTEAEQVLVGNPVQGLGPSTHGLEVDGRPQRELAVQDLQVVTFPTLPALGKSAVHHLRRQPSESLDEFGLHERVVQGAANDRLLVGEQAVLEVDRLQVAVEDDRLEFAVHRVEVEPQVVPAHGVTRSPDLGQGQVPPQQHLVKCLGGGNASVHEATQQSGGVEEVGGEPRVLGDARRLERGDRRVEITPVRPVGSVQQVVLPEPGLIELEDHSLPSLL